MTAAVSISRSGHQIAMRDVSSGPTGPFGAQGSSACGKGANPSSGSGKMDRFSGDLIVRLFHIRNWQSGQQGVPVREKGT